MYDLLIYNLRVLGFEGWGEVPKVRFLLGFEKSRNRLFVRVCCWEGQTMRSLRGINCLLFRMLGLGMLMR